MEKEKVVTLEDRIPKLKKQRRQKNNRRLAVYISIFFLLVLCFTYFQSPLSKVGSVKVSGNHYLSGQTIREAAGLSPGKSGFWDHTSRSFERRLLKTGKIKSAVVHKHFPNNISIRVEEYERIAYLHVGGKYYPILENGTRLSALQPKTVPVGAPILNHFKDKGLLEGISKACQQLPQAVRKQISEIDYTPTKNFPDGITVYMVDGFEVLALIHDFAQNMADYPKIISQIDSKAEGIIHMRIGIYFSKYESKGESSNDTKK